MTTVQPEPLTRRGVPLDHSLRLLALGAFVNRAGGGLLVTVMALYFTNEVGLAPSQVGLALGLAGVASLLVNVPAGHAGDRFGPARMMTIFTIASGVSSLGLIFARDAWSLVVVLVVSTGLMTSAGAVRNGYIAQIARGGEGVAFKAYLRAVTNTAIACGALLGGLTLWADQQWAYLAAFAFNGVSSMVTGLLAARLPEIRTGLAPGASKFAVFRDTPFVVVSLLNAVFAMHFIVMEVGVALWIGRHTSAPLVLYPVLLGLNTISVALFQVRLSRASTSVTASARQLLRGSLWLGAGFVAIAMSGGVPVWLAIGLLTLGTVLAVYGEMIGSGGQWGVQMGLAPHERQGQYQGFAGMSFSLATILGPILTTWLCIEWGRPGWFVMAGLVIASAALTIPVSNWAIATREKYGAASASL
jgi:MFS family permease